MSTYEILALFGTMAVLAAIPSASVALVVARSVTAGVPHGIVVSMGVVAGDLLFIGLAMFGLAAVAETMGALFTAVKYVGALYLMWLGVSLLRAKPDTQIAIGQATERGNVFASFFSGFFLTLGDVKAILFYLSLLPMFVDLAALRSNDVLVVVFVTVVAVGGVKAGYAIFAYRVIASVRGKRFRAFTMKAAGTALLGAGGYMAVKG